MGDDNVFNKRCIQAIAGLIGICCVSSASAADIRIGTEAGYPPWNSTNASGEIVGFEPDMLQKVCKAEKLDCRLVAQAWEGIIPGLQTGKFDAIVSGISITDERAKTFDFSKSYAAVPSRFYAKGAGGFEALTTMPAVNLATVSPERTGEIEKLKAALKGKTVGVISSTVQAKFLDKFLGDSITVKNYEKQDSLVLDLLADRVDAAFSDVTTWIDVLKEHREVTAFGPSFSGGLFGRGIGVGVPKGNNDLLAKFNDGIDHALADGSLSQLSTKWFGFDVTPKP